MTTATQRSTRLCHCRAGGPLGVIVFILSLALVPSAQAQFTYSDFSDISNLARNGTAQQFGSTLRLTPASYSSGLAGSVWYTVPQPVTNGFETTFAFQITGSAGPYCDSPGGGDGLTFTIQNNDTTALGNIGGYLGYHGILNSVAVEFDTCYNTWDPGSLSNRNHNHIGINLGSVASAITFTPTENINSGAVYTVRIVYQSDTLDVYFNDLNGSPVLSHTFDLPSFLGGTTAYVGFTSGVAASYGNHLILSWSFTTGNLDSDGDSVPDDEDNCPDDANTDQADLDEDGLGDVCDPDADNDGFLGAIDDCADLDPAIFPGAIEICTDGIDNDCDLLIDAADDGADCDGDTVPNAFDNCPNVANPGQADLDEDGLGDVCDDDDDNDGYEDGEDNCPVIANDQADWDMDGVGDACDDDADGDSVDDAVDLCLSTARSDTDAGVPSKRLGKNRWADTDGDRIFDTTGKNPTGRAFTIWDTAGCNCAQIVEVCGYGKGHTKFGCSNSVMDWWTGLYDREGEDPYQCK